MFYLLHAPFSRPRPFRPFSPEDRLFYRLPLIGSAFPSSPAPSLPPVLPVAWVFRGCRFAGPVVWAMGVPKRKASEGPSSAASPAGTVKRTRAEEFTGVRFKTLLKDAQGPGPGEWERTPQLRGSSRHSGASEPGSELVKNSSVR